MNFGNYTGINNLKDTIILMKSDDFKERFRAEYYQLKIRYNGLKSMIEKYENGTLTFKPKTPITIFKDQLQTMQKYMFILENRAKLEDISLEVN